MVSGGGLASASFSSSLRQAVRAAIWGHYHGGNLGDELVVATLADAIRARQREAQIVAVSQAPADTRLRHGLETFPLAPSALPGSVSRPTDTPRPRWQSRLRAAARRLPLLRQLWRFSRSLSAALDDMAFCFPALRFLRRVDILVVAGSGQLIDKFCGPFGHPYALFRWCSLARLTRTSVLLPSVGAGPLTHPLSRFFVRRALARAAYVSVRDVASAGVLHAVGVRRPLPVVPDMAWASTAAWRAAAAVGERPRVGSRVVGLNVMAHEDPRYWSRGDLDRYTRYLRTMATFARRLLDNGYTVRVFSSQNRADEAPARELLQILESQGAFASGELVWTIDPSAGAEDLIANIVDCDLVVAARYHSILLPLLLGIPTIGLAYNHKTTELMRGVGLPQWCFDIDAASAADLCAAVESLWNYWPSYRPQVHDIALRNRLAVERQFDVLFGASGLASRG
ncbi:MAG TPA: polysaccharide pyruvyl transferase family protein [Gemmatimonadaceae bacterium]|nr:polysaccharide pyruvyl transferase family protein [Gemmatimonadaceae bacterium]